MLSSPRALMYSDGHNWSFRIPFNMRKVCLQHVFRAIMLSVSAACRRRLCQRHAVSRPPCKCHIDLGSLSDRSRWDSSTSSAEGMSSTDSSGPRLLLPIARKLVASQEILQWIDDSIMIPNKLTKVNPSVQVI